MSQKMIFDEPEVQDTGTRYKRASMNSTKQGFSTNATPVPGYRLPSEHEGTKIVTLLPFQQDLQPSPPQQRQFANTTPLALCAFAMTALIESLANANIRDGIKPNIAVGPAYVYGGLAQLLCGMWAIASGNAFEGTIFTSYGAFWWSWAIIETKAFGITAAYSTQSELNTAVGYYLFAWSFLTIFFTLFTLKSNLVLFTLFIFLDMNFILCTVGYLYQTPKGHPHDNLIHAAGVEGIITVCIAMYFALAGLADEKNFPFKVPVFPFPWSEEGKMARQQPHMKTRAEP